MQVVLVPVFIGNFYMGCILFLILLVFFLLRFPILCAIFYGQALGFVTTQKNLTDFIHDMLSFPFFSLSGFLVSHLIVAAFFVFAFVLHAFYVVGLMLLQVSCEYLPSRSGLYFIFL